MREQIRIASKMYECQDSAKQLWKKEYPAKVKWYVDTLRKVMAKENISNGLKAVLFVSKLDAVKDNGMAIMMFMAAAVEIIEPSTT